MHLTCIHQLTYIHTHTHIYTYISQSQHSAKPAIAYPLSTSCCVWGMCLHAYTHTCIHTYIHTYTHAYHSRNTVQVLDLTNNSTSSINDLPHLTNVLTYIHTRIHTYIHTYTHTYHSRNTVQVLDLTNNSISSINELTHLSGCESLRSLTLMKSRLGNPICSSPVYASTVAAVWYVHVCMCVHTYVQHSWRAVLGTLYAARLCMPWLWHRDGMHVYVCMYVCMHAFMYV
jgi:hypothetical protein